MKQIQFFTIAIFVSAFLISCSIADLRPKDHRGIEPSESKIQNSLETFMLPRERQIRKWSSLKKVEMTVTDSWNSWLVRQFTPLDYSETRMRISLYPLSSDIKVTFADRESTSGFELRSGKLYQFEAGTETSISDSSTKLYLESLSLYLRLPLEIQELDFFLQLPSERVENREFLKYYASNSGFELSGSSDQYICYVNQPQHEVNFIEFTYREVMESYRGVLEYLDYADQNGISYPHRIQIKDNITEDSFIHEIRIEKIQF